MSLGMSEFSGRFHDVHKMRIGISQIGKLWRLGKLGTFRTVKMLVLGGKAEELTDIQVACLYRRKRKV